MSLWTVASPPVEHFGRQVERRAGEARDAARAGVAQLAGAEVHQDDAAALLAHHVLRLDVAMDEAGAVDGGERAAQILADERRFARAERRPALQQLARAWRRG